MSDTERHADQDTEGFLVVCLCAEWCGICRDYRPAFLAMEAEFPGAKFHWLDIEDHADLLGDRDIENFPTLHIQRGNKVLFFGTMLPHHAHLRRMLQVFHAQSADESFDYARKSPEHIEWQELAVLRDHISALSRGNTGGLA